MDITQHFKASVMTVRLQRKTELAAAAKSKTQDKQQRSAAAKPTAGTNDFAKRAKDVCNDITTLRNVLIENRTAYMRIGQHLKSATHMTDAQRDFIDRGTEKFVTLCTQHLANMRRDYKSAKRKPQERQHIEAVIDLLISYLHSVEQIYLDQKKYRVQHELETYRLLKLAADKKKIPVRPAGATSGKVVKRQTSNDDENSNELTTSLEDVEEANDWNNDSWANWDDEQDSSSKTAEQQSLRKRNRRGEQNSTDSSAKVALDEDIQKTELQLENDEEALSAEDMQLFEAENVHIYNLLQGVSEEVEQIEKNVVDIAQLQDIFTEKVAMQQQNIDRIVSAVIGTTENVKDANEQIRQATQRNAGLRVWSLFFLLVMSFSLLFLDWYYD
ncbi:hypothetical protein ACLKA7_008314 [Drosophila subpalustris]